jgi:hypothetical protein
MSPLATRRAPQKNDLVVLAGGWWCVVSAGSDGVVIRPWQAGIEGEQTLSSAEFHRVLSWNRTRRRWAPHEAIQR